MLRKVVLRSHSVKSLPRDSKFTPRSCTFRATDSADWAERLSLTDVLTFGCATELSVDGKPLFPLWSIRFHSPPRSLTMSDIRALFHFWLHDWEVVVGFGWQEDRLSEVPGGEPDQRPGTQLPSCLSIVLSGRLLRRNKMGYWEGPEGKCVDWNVIIGEKSEVRHKAKPEVSWN